MDSKLVSIIIPCYKQAHWVAQAVQSCLDQSYPHVQIVVVNDGSPDDVAGALRPFSRYVTLVNQENRGLSSARNTGLHFAKGQYVKFLDADDWLLPRCLEWQVEALENSTNDIALIGYRMWFENNDRSPMDIYPSHQALEIQLCYINTGPPHALLFSRKSVRDAVQFLPELPGNEDYEFLCRLVGKGYKATVIDRIGCVYRQTPGSMSKQWQAMSSSRFFVWRRYVDSLLDNEAQSELLVHILGGYELLQRQHVIRYEGMFYFERIMREIKECLKKFSAGEALMLADRLANVLRSLPQPRSLQEQAEREASLECIQNMTTSLLSTMVSTDPANGFRRDVLSLTALWILNCWSWGRCRSNRFVQRVSLDAAHLRFFFLRAHRAIMRARKYRFPTYP
jgi:glycosyltransferase involved in cell wall biosynthesis